MNISVDIGVTKNGKESAAQPVMTSSLLDRLGSGSIEALNGLDSR